MIVLSHRGYWRAPVEKNSAVAFHRSYDLGFGTETDVRDRGGDLVIAHDMARAADMTLDAMLDILANRDLPLALNIKADGLADALAERMRARPLTRWFTFDMAVPDLVQQLRKGLPAFTRCSEYEREPACYNEAAGVWLDAFETTWYRATDIAAFLRDGKAVCVVSPELHGRDPLPLWSELRASEVRDHASLMICTDRPQDAATHFGAPS